jgi:DNA-binding LacI/PurR family transcriptional regulator
MSDILAIGALEATAELGVAVPARLSVVGFDDGPAAEHAAPPLTTVAQPHEEKGRLAAQWLLEDVERGGTPRRRRRRKILPTKLIVRESTAPPSAE